MERASIDVPVRYRPAPRRRVPVHHGSSQRPREDWAAVLDGLIAGDRASVLKVSRFVTGLLGRWQAYDFRDDWSDMVQEVLIALLRGLREGRLRERRAAAGYIRQIAQHKFADRLRRHARCAEDDTHPIEEESWVPVAAEDPGELDLGVDLQGALSRLPERKRAAVLAVYVEGRTYEEAARETGIPLGTLKRDLRQALAALRKELGSSGDAA